MIDMATITITITDGNATEQVDSIEAAVAAVKGWYDYLADDGQLDALPEFPGGDVDDLDDLTAAIAEWEAEIAAALGAKPFAGHGSYHVSAASEAGLRLTVTETETESGDEE